jgi:hypothetical protein
MKQVIITKCSSIQYWYRNQIGEVFEVENTMGTWFKLSGNNGEIRAIYYEDCELYTLIRTCSTCWFDNSGMCHLFSGECVGHDKWKQKSKRDCSDCKHNFEAKYPFTANIKIENEDQLESLKKLGIL